MDERFNRIIQVSCEISDLRNELQSKEVELQQLVNQQTFEASREPKPKAAKAAG